MPSARNTGEHVDLLDSEPSSPLLEDRKAFLLIDAAAQITALADLVDRGWSPPTSSNVSGARSSDREVGELASGLSERINSSSG